ncbi:hypothetical protein D5085_18345 [Ectothiorhodospiraceae bacterium BW-2]|nr:hypothetical protein D5085_18345 [Ectothiorhodospiraceae bacterium BW-2]
MRYLLFAFLWFIGASQAEPLSVEIVYEARPPFVIKEGDSLSGRVATPLMVALERGGLAYQLTEKPSKRHLHEIKANQAALCAVGWFKNSEREQYAKYSQPLYRDRPMAILIHRSNGRFSTIHSVDDLFADTALLPLIKTSYSYGQFIDTRLVESGVKVRQTGTDNITMMSMIAKRRADYMFISREKSDELLQQHPERERLSVKPLEGMPEGNSRYLICSQQVEDAFLDRLNAGLNLDD